jgi:hypothetical protein
MKTFINILNQGPIDSEVTYSSESIKVKNKHNYVPKIGSRITVKEGSYNVINIHYDFDKSKLTISVR